LCIQNSIHGEHLLQLKNEISKTRLWAHRMLQDPIAVYLQENSHLTKVQIETLIIDFLLDGFSGARTDYETKATLRQKQEKPRTKRGVTRGAFNRSLAQARKNVIQSIFTLVLLGYLGLFENPSLIRYQDLAETIRSYANDYDRIAGMNEKPKDIQLLILKQAQKRILEFIEELSRPLSLKTR